MANAEPQSCLQDGKSQSIDRTVIEGLIELGGDDSSFVVEVIDIYLDDSMLRVKALAQAIVQGDIDQVEKLAHSLKSASANVGALLLAQICSEAEKRARGRSPIAEVAPLVQRIGEVHDAAMRELRSIRTTVAG